MKSENVFLVGYVTGTVVLLVASLCIRCAAPSKWDAGYKKACAEQGLMAGEVFGEMRCAPTEDWKRLLEAEVTK